MKPLSKQEVADFMHKLSTESTKVVAQLVNPLTGVTCSLAGRSERDGDTFTVWAEKTSAASRFTEASTFKVSVSRLEAFMCRFADPRILPIPPGWESEAAFSFGLVFNLPDGSLLIFMDFSDQPPRNP
jgi:hypothetical protein